MKDVNIYVESVGKLPDRTYKKGSIYDPVLDAFLKGKDKTVRISSEGKTATYLRTALLKRVNLRELSMEIKTVNNEVYMIKP